MVFSIKQTEGLIFWIGCSLFIFQAIILIILWIFNPLLAAHILAVIMASILGGRIASVLTGLELGMNSVLLILILSVFNASWLLVFYPMIVKFFDSEHAGKRVTDYVRLVDAMPTILESLDIDAGDNHMDGESLLGLLRASGEGGGDRTFLCELAANVVGGIPQRVAVNRGKDKLILNDPYSKEAL